jgi:hypothetical protein
MRASYNGDVRLPSAENLGEYAATIIPQYARTPADALQCQLDAVADVDRLRRLGVLPSLPGWMRDARDGVDDLRQFTGAPLYFWTSHVATLVEQASRSYPIQQETFVPNLPGAFCVFERPTLSVMIHGVQAGLSAVSWLTGRDSVNGRLKLRVRGLVWTPGHANVCFSFEVTDPLRMPTSEDATFADEVLAVYRWICSASMFVEQRILEHVPGHVDRHTARRAARVEISPTCNVVQMRRLDRRRRGDDDAAAIQWQCQWLVRGHWRRQFYPRAGRHVPRWIAPYVKGPDDKPMKAPKPTVFAVTR